MHHQPLREFVSIKILADRWRGAHGYGVTNKDHAFNIFEVLVLGSGAVFANKRGKLIVIWADKTWGINIVEALLKI
jgi:hypothetical protein